VQLVAGTTASELTTTVTADDWKVDTVQGIVLVKEAFADMYVQVTYTAGFGTTNKPPDWLTEAILTYVPTVLNNQQITNRNEEVKPIADKAKEIGDELVAPYVLLPAFIYRPLIHNA
jgi:hypothetical protein